MLLPIRCVVIGNSYGYVIDLDVAYEAYHPLYIFKLMVGASKDSGRQVSHIQVFFNPEALM